MGNVLYSHQNVILYIRFNCRGTLYSRYSTNDWDSSNKQNFHLSERERNLAERLRADAYRAVKATDARTRNRQQANTKRLGRFHPPKSDMYWCI
jgi:hypothetical protein